MRKYIDVVMSALRARGSPTVTLVDAISEIGTVMEASTSFGWEAYLSELGRVRNRVVNRFAGAIDKEIEAALLLVKVLNLAITKWEYVHRCTSKLAKPIGFMLDPANSCQLGCATCQNSSNRAYVARTYKSIPRRTMKANMFDRFMREFGATAFCGHFYNNHEPFLNRNTPAFIRAANEYRVDTLASSNLSLPLDAELIVASGLHTLMVAVDGVTQGSYQKYRRGGEIELVFENVRKIAMAKRRYGTPYPYLRWQYLTFEHNIGEIDAAISLAPELGFDSINFATPYDVSADDPTVHAVSFNGPEAKRHVVINPEPDLAFSEAIPVDKAEHVLALLHRDLDADRSRRKAPAVSNGTAVQRGMCDWLHFGVVVDAVGRVGSCCISDFKGGGRIYLGDFEKEGGQVFNSELFVASRTLLNDREEYADEMSGKSAEERPFCEMCSTRPLPQVGLQAASHYMRRNWRLKDTPNTLLDALAGWSAHQYCGLRTEGEHEAGSAEKPVITFLGQQDDSVVRGLDARFGDATVIDETLIGRYGNRLTAEQVCRILVPGDRYAERRALIGGARIVDVFVVNDVARGKFSVVIKILFEDEVEAPIVGLSLHDDSGMLVAAMNSLWEGIRLSPAMRNSVRYYRFDVDLNGFDQVVYLEPAIAASTSEVLDRRTSVLCVLNN